MAVKDIGMHGAVVANLTTRELRAFQGGIVLHVKSTMKAADYDHYILFLGTSNGKAKVLDPFELVKLVPFKELALRWDGTGLIISVRPISAISVFAIGMKHFLVFAGIAVACILLVRWTKYELRASMLDSRRSLLRLSIAQFLGFVVVALVCGALYHSLRDEGYLAYPDAIAAIQEVHLRNFIPKIGIKRVRKLLGSDTIFLDARYASDYQAGHLKGAINVPVDANEVERQKATVDIAKDTRLVVYCQSAGCKFAEKVAIRLVRDGFSDVSIFKGGWAEWQDGKEE
ncbi:MAG: rhodanese-like domain-containing protein [Planctomycetota bacterium]